MARIRWNDDALLKVANEAAAASRQEMQAVLDALGVSEAGKDVSAVKATLGARWQRDFGTKLSDQLLDACGEQLASGTRVVLKERMVS
jgi:hypothetical protein